MPQQITRAAAKAAGLKLYFTGKPCKHGHTSERYARNACCLECDRQVQVKRHLANPRRKDAANAAWTAANKPRIAAVAAARYIANKPKIAAVSAAWYAANKPKKAATAAAWASANKARKAATNAAWSVANRGTVNANCARRAARKTHATPAWADHDAIKHIYAQAAQLGLEVDHVYPLQGKLVCGLHVHTNMQLLTRSENASKGNRYTP